MSVPSDHTDYDGIRWSGETGVSNSEVDSRQAAVCAEANT